MVDSYTSASLTYFLRVVFSGLWFSIAVSFFVVGLEVGVRTVTEAFHVLSLNYASTVTDTTANIPSLLFTVSENMKSVASNMVSGIDHKHRPQLQ